MSQAKLPEVQGNRAQQDFILAVKSLDDSWSANELSQLIKAEADDKPYTSISDLVAQYESYYRRTRPIASGLGTFATLGITSQSSSGSPQSSSAPSPTTQGSRRSRSIVCLCGDRHKFEYCLYVNKALRPSGWQPAHDIEQKFQQLRSQATDRARVLYTVEKKLGSATGPVTASATRLSPRSTPDTVKKWDDRRQPSGPAATAALQLGAVQVEQQKHELSLLNRWIIDPGSNTHVANSKAHN
jgi:hypothetical protein